MKKKSKNIFANLIVVLCVLMSMVICIATILSYLTTNESIPSSVVTAMTIPFTGELLIICLRQIFGRDIVTQAKTNTKIIQEEETDDNEVNSI